MAARNQPPLSPETPTNSCTSYPSLYPYTCRQGVALFLVCVSYPCYHCPRQNRKTVCILMNTCMPQGSSFPLAKSPNVSKRARVGPHAPRLVPRAQGTRSLRTLLSGIILFLMRECLLVCMFLCGCVILFFGAWHTLPSWVVSSCLLFRVYRPHMLLPCFSSAPSLFC